MKLSEKLTKINDSFTVNMYDNGYMVEASGRSADEDWASAKIMCQTVEELTAIIEEAATMERET